MNAPQEILEQIAEKLIEGDANSVAALTRNAIDQHIEASDVLNKGLLSGMDVVGKRFKKNEFFIPEVMIAAKAMKSGMEIIKPLLAAAKIKARGKVVLCTVKGDLHDIGKNIVSMMLEGAGYDIVDLGADVTKEVILEQIKAHQPDVLGLSALLTTTMGYMKEVIEALDRANLRQQIKVIIGGAPVTQTYSEEIHADGYGPDAVSAVDQVNRLLGL
ncbi:corrinoid protein [bacterium]|nr:corrinoid protein [bacterium]